MSTPERFDPLESLLIPDPAVHHPERCEGIEHFKKLWAPFAEDVPKDIWVSKNQFAHVYTATPSPNGNNATNASASNTWTALQRMGIWPKTNNSLVNVPLSETVALANLKEFERGNFALNYPNFKAIFHYSDEKAKTAEFSLNCLALMLCNVFFLSSSNFDQSRRPLFSPYMGRTRLFRLSSVVQSIRKQC